MTMSLNVEGLEPREVDLTAVPAPVELVAAAVAVVA